MLGVAAWVLSTAVWPETPDRSDPSAGYWSPHARKIASVAGADARPAWSPDRTRYVSQDGGGVYLGVGRKIVRFHVSFTPNLVEVLWAPNARFAAITGSDGGAVGSWSILLIDARGEDVSQRLKLALRKKIHLPAKCVEAEAPNYAALRWRGGDVLVVKVQVPPHSNCANLGQSVEVTIKVSDLRPIRVRPATNLKRRT
ncbi:hypothetical protein [Sphingomonas sp.]|uniref:hypothetical protein n=1 Tax=Sphingomonas sp. TaxID=28214 RepID=UPI002FDB632C